MVGQRVVGEGAAGDDVRTHAMTASHVAVFGLPWWLCPAAAQNVSSRACSSSRPVARSVLGVEAWVASPEPAVGVFTPAGTCQGRLRRHFVIGYAAR